jgi:HPt (histidine-containing phosphotransfer) domain-containing protein
MSAPVLDREHLARYTDGDAALEAELFSLLRGQIEACSARLTAAGDDADAWRDAAHTLKGAARGVGAMALADACEAAEDKPQDETALAAVRAAADAAVAAMDAASSAPGMNKAAG